MITVTETQGATLLSILIIFWEGRVRLSIGEMVQVNQRAEGTSGVPTPTPRHPHVDLQKGRLRRGWKVLPVNSER